MTLETASNPVATSFLGRLWQNFLLFGAAMEMSDTELLERRVRALESAADNGPKKQG